MKKDEVIKHIDLNHDITQTDLMNLLNKKFGGKKFSTKNPTEMIQFNQQDIQGYLRRGALPLKYGGNKITVIKGTGSGLVILRIKKVNEIMSLPDFEIKSK